MKNLQTWKLQFAFPLFNGDVQKLVDLLKIIFNVKELRRNARGIETIGHFELKIDDTILMLADCIDGYPANKMMLHIFVPDIFKIFDITIQNECKIIEKSIQKLSYEDVRGGFMDFAGNSWFISKPANCI